MTPDVLIGSLAVLCVAQKLAAVKMAIRVEADTQKAVAIDAGIDQAQFTRKLNGQEPFTFQNFDALPEEVQRTALLEMLSHMGLPARAKRWLSIASLVNEQKRSA
jgi:alkylhydroperoxidase/carboxymuconolactone decarboxylase family protein YurZ